MTCKIRRTIEKYKMLDSVKSVAVGVSGGADSVCLLHYLSTIRQEYDIVVKAVHVNHNIRGEQADSDCDFVRALCRKLDVELQVFSVDVPSLASEKGMSVEECGRFVRYECFRKSGCDAIAVAHTLSDSIETMLFNFARGTALKGVCGIPPKRDTVIRPLIECTRDEIESYCREHSLAFVTDSTNLLDDYARNKIRHHAVPVLRQINPEFEKCALRFFYSVYEDFDYIQTQAQRLIKESRIDAESFRLSLWRESHKAVRNQALGLLLAANMKKSVETRHVELCNRLIQDGSGRIELTKDLYLAVKGDIIAIQSRLQTSKPWCVAVEGEFINAPYGSYRIRQYNIDKLDHDKIEHAIDADTVKGNLVMRSRLPGDTIKDAKRNNTKTLKKLFCEMKIPCEKRNEIALLCDENGVVWAENIGVNAANAVSGTTKRVYIVEKRG